MKSKTVIGAILLACLATPATVLAGGRKIDVCHLDRDSGTYHLISVKDPAAHFEHGDACPGDAVPNKPGFEFGPSCELVNIMACPTEGTVTDTLGSHSFWLYVNGSLLNYIGTSESWVWFFNWGAYWNKFYPGDLLDFCVDAECSAPYSCYVPAQ